MTRDYLLARKIKQVASELSRLDRRLREVETSAQGRYRAVTGGGTTYYDNDGVPQVVVGEQPDGTNTVVDVNSPALDEPSAPILVARAGTITVTWDGLDYRGFDDWPATFSHVEVHVSPIEGFEVTDETDLATITSITGGISTFALSSATPYFFRLAVINTSGARSIPSAEVSGQSLPVETEQGIKVYREDEAPIGLGLADVGSIWFDTNDGNHQYIWTGTAWVSVRDTEFGAINEALDQAFSNIETRNGISFNNVTNGDPVPVALATDDLWFKPDEDYRPYRWDGDSWEPLAFGSTSILDDAINEFKLAVDAVNRDAIKDGEVLTAALAQGAVVTDKIANSAITARHLTANSITATSIAASSITASHIKAFEINASHLSAGTVTATAIAAGSIYASALTASVIRASAIATGQITATHLSAGVITATAIAAQSITATAIAAQSITATAIAARSILASALSANVITATAIGAFAITATAISANAITATAMAANSITATAIAVDALTAKHRIAGALITTATNPTTTYPDGTGERIVIRNDGNGGIIEGYSGLNDTETPASINPFISGSTIPGLRISSGRLSGHTGLGAYLEMITFGTSSAIATLQATTEVNFASGNNTITLSALSGISLRADAYIAGTLIAASPIDSRARIETTGGFFDTNYVGSPGPAVYNTNGRIIMSGSSRALKKDIEPLTLDEAVTALSMEPVKFRWREEMDMGECLQAGFIAEQSRDVGAGLWVTEDEGHVPTGIRYGELTAAHNLLIDDLRKRIAATEAALSEAGITVSSDNK